jgi:hypothetical protein
LEQGGWADLLVIPARRFSTAKLVKPESSVFLFFGSLKDQVAGFRLSSE